MVIKDKRWSLYFNLSVPIYKIHCSSQPPKFRDDPDIIHTSIQRINSLKQENANATVATAVASSGTKSKHTKQKDRSSNEGKNLRGVEAFVGK